MVMKDVEWRRRVHNDGFVDVVAKKVFCLPGGAGGVPPCSRTGSKQGLRGFVAI